MYRCPGSDIVSFNHNIEQLFCHIRYTKTLCISGNFNIDSLKRGSHNGTKEFLDVLYSLGLYTLINRHTRISTTSATLIDNIFTFELESKIVDYWCMISVITFQYLLWAIVLQSTISVNALISVFA